LEDLQEQYDDEQNARIKAEKTVRELEDEIEELKEELSEADNRAQLEELKNRQEQELELMRFKLDRESDLRKKSEEAVAAYKAQNEHRNKQFKMKLVPMRR